MADCSLIDLDHAQLRAYWTEDDFQYLLLQKPRLFALMMVNSEPRSNPLDGVYLGEQDFLLINQRRATIRDRHEGFEHPRDLPITGSAYHSLLEYVRNYVMAGQYTLPPDWRERFPDIAAFADGHLPAAEDYPFAECEKNQ